MDERMNAALEGVIIMSGGHVRRSVGAAGIVRARRRERGVMSHLFQL